MDTKVKYFARLCFPSLGQIDTLFPINELKEILYFPLLNRYISPLPALEFPDTIPQIKKMKFVYEKQKPIRFEIIKGEWKPIEFEVEYSFDGIQ